VLHNRRRRLDAVLTKLVLYQCVKLCLQLRCRVHLDIVLYLRTFLRSYFRTTIPVFLRVGELRREDIVAADGLGLSKLRTFNWVRGRMQPTLMSFGGLEAVGGLRGARSREGAAL
jgi:hypothetical protein